MKTIIIGLVAILVAIALQVAFIGINGLTIVSIPLTMYLGFHVIEKLTNEEETI